MSQYPPKEVFDLEETLKQYQRQSPEAQQFYFNLLDCTWKDVLHELEKAKDAVSENEKRGEGLNRKAWRRLETVGDVLGSGLAAFPDHLSVLNGGLVVIFSLARHQPQHRQNILRAFEDIPNVMLMARGKAESIPRDCLGIDNLRAAIGELEQILLRIIPLLIERLNPGTSVGNTLNSSRTNDIDNLLIQVHNGSQTVRICTGEIMDNLTVNHHHIIDHENPNAANNIQIASKQTPKDVTELHAEIAQLLQHQKAFQNTLDGISNKNALLSFLIEYTKDIEQQDHTDPSTSKKFPPPDYEPATSVTPRQMLGLMDVHYLSTLNDEQHIVRRGRTLDPDAISHAATIFQTSQVRQLLHSPESGIVLVNGCSDRSQNTKISPITYICATLTNALRHTAGSDMVLSFFCGQHSAPGDNLIGPQGLMRSLVTNLVLNMVQHNYISDVEPIWFSAVQVPLDELTFQDICEVFYHLIELIPKEVKVYCVVDGISYFERPIWKDNYDLMMKCFSNIIENKAVIAIFKLLLASPTVSRGLPDLLPHQRVSLKNFRARATSNADIYLQPALEESTSPSQHAQYYFNDSEQPIATHVDTDLVESVTLAPSDSGYGTASLRSGKEPATVWHHALKDPTDGIDCVQPQGLNDLTNIDFDDNKTVYTQASGLPVRSTELYIGEMAKDLFEKVDAGLLTDQAIEKLVSILPRLLKALALRLGYEAPSQMHRDVMVFIHKHRSAITDSFKLHFTQTSDSELDSQSGLDTQSGILATERRPTEILNRWLGNADETEYENVPDEARAAYAEFDVHEDEDEEEDDELSIPGLEEYRKFVFGDPGYAWMLERLSREILLSRPDPDIMEDIREKLLQALPRTNRVSRKVSSQGAKVIFAVDWDILAFLGEQDYQEDMEYSIANAITLTGSSVDAQALSCSDYLAQTWPSTGTRTLRLVQDLLKNTNHESRIMSESTGELSLMAVIQDATLIVEAIGVPDFVAEIAEQLAWLSAALRPSPSKHGPICCTPFIDECIVLEDEPMSLHCNIKCQFEPCIDGQFNRNGQCWHNMFSNPVIVQGFPVPLRSEKGTGLEIPLNMMASLTRARYINSFDSKLFIKGFSTMLVPTNQSGDLIKWHFLYNKDPEDRMSYLGCRLEHANIKILDLERSRHVIGWCSDAICNAGTSAANYSIRKSNLAIAYTSCALNKIEISGGQFITGTAGFTLGNREKPVHISRTGYLTKLQWISSKYFVFWDEEEKRGWLLNGASALLHILRDSLAHSKRKLQSAFLLGPISLPDAKDPTAVDSAMSVLIDENNRDLKLYLDKSEVYEEETRDGPRTRIVSTRQTRYYRLEDRVEHIYNSLEKLIDHQTDIERRSGLQLNPRPRRQLEGWDFKDLATDGDPFFPRVTTLMTIGKGWVDFARALHAVTLFGRGFGDLIQPKQTGLMHCPRWARLPCERYYLAACVSDIQEIMECNGDEMSNPRRLCQKIIWHMKQSTFQPCPCTKKKKTAQHHDPVQALFPVTFGAGLRKKPQVALERRGAVIFGHSMNLHWYWKDSGDPVKGDPPLPEEEENLRCVSSDSGLGSSIGTLSSNSTAGETTEAKSPGSSTLSGDRPDTTSSAGSDCEATTICDRVMAGSKRRLLDASSSVRQKMRI